MLYKHFQIRNEKNLKGRDIIIGDLHGMYDLLMDEMENINFDRNADRLLDSWGVEGISPETRLYQSVGDNLLLRFRYRYYRQSRADFQRTTYPSADIWDDRATTSDPKLAAFDSHMLGLRIDVFTRFFGDTILDFAEDGSVYIAVDRQLSDISYGPGVIGSAGGALPF